MARRAPSSDSSQKENTGMPTRVKAQKLKKEKMKKDKPAPLEEQARRERDGAGDPGEETLDEEESSETMVNGHNGADDGEEEEDGDESPRRKKRTRVNDEGESINVKSERKGKGKARPMAHPRDVDGYVPGSIVRILLHNFVTYDDVEFCPGPYLNMILGPNGTGKSSIACAICLGLNFPPSVLGRATELSSFVKQGYTEGFIEIELKGLIDHSNLIIRRHLKSTGRGSTFHLNGENATAKEVTERVKALNVQVNNLCAFLPQDKVAEFAQMTPQQLLIQTQLAAGDGHLSDWHKKLIEGGKELKKVNESVSSDRDELNTLKQRNAMLERDVQLYKQRREIEREVELVELLLPFKEYMDAKEIYTDLKEKRSTLHQLISDLELKNKPAHDLKKQLEADYNNLDKERDARKDAARAKFRELRTKYDTSEKLGEDSAGITDKLVNLKKEEKARRERVAQLKKDIIKIEQELAHPPEVEDLAAVEHDRLQNLDAVHENKREEDEIKQKLFGFGDESERQKREIARFEQEIKNLDSIAHRRLEELAKWDRDLAEVVRWIRNNQQRFKYPIIEPAVLCLDIPNQRYAPAVEACFNGNQLRTIVAQCQEDYKLLNRLVVDTPEAMGRKIHASTWFRPKRMEDLLPPPMTAEEMHQLGFEKYAIEYVDCPEGLLWYLQMEVGLHRTAIGLDGSRIETNRVMEAVSRFTPSGKGGGASFVAGNVFNNVQRSRYGRRVPVNMTKDVGRGRNLVHQPVDQTHKREFEQNIGQARTIMEEAEAEILKWTEVVNRVIAQGNQIKAEQKTIEARRKAILDVQKRIQHLGLRLENFGEKLRKEENAPSLDTERQKLREKIFTLAKKRATIAKQLKVIIQGIIQEQTEATRVGLQFVQVNANKLTLDKLCQERDTEYQQARTAFEEVDVLYTESKRDTKKKLDHAKALMNNIDDELRATFHQMDENGEIANRSADDLSQDLAELKAKLELNLATNPGVVEQFEQREADINNLKGKIANREARQRSIEKEIKGVKDQWYPALQELVTSIGEKFSQAFDRVRCAGEVRLAEHEEDYEKWAIDILVKFRDSEKLQLLTGTRQSGGERALSTIMYLMSLTELARAPFSLVDEINQGMDSTYERAVHNSLVSVTCKADSGQYFLITPKLLTDLDYHERMKVLCVNNGEWLPEPELGIGGNMMKMIDTFLEVARSNQRIAAP